MRKSVENRAENYIKRHRNYRKWLAFALCIAMLTGTVTLYGLNKPATAMTEDAFGSMGIIDTASDEDEQRLIEEMYNNDDDENGDDGDEVAGGNDNGDEESGNPDDESDDESDDENGDDNSDDANESNPDDMNKENESGDDDPASSEEDDEAAKKATLGEGASDEASSEDSSESASDASSEATTAAADDASSLESSEISLEASSEVSLDEKELEELKDVVITVYYVDAEGTEFSEAKELSIEDSFDIKEDAKKFDGYIYKKALLGDEETEIVSINKKTKEVSVEKEENEDSAASLAEVEDEVLKYVYYEAVTEEGEEIEITEDTDLKLVYDEVNTQEKFVVSVDGMTVTVILSKPEEFPKGIGLNVTPLDKFTSGYNYDAYMDALNANAQAIAEAAGREEAIEYDESNTMLFDIAFVLDEIEYEPKEGTVSVSVSFDDSQLSSEMETEKEEDVSVLHFPIKDAVKEGYASTSDATGISADDINVDILTESEVSLGEDADVISFTTSSFSVYGAVTYSDDGYTWDGTKSFTPNGAVEMLGKATYFGAVAIDYYGGGRQYPNGQHSEANIAVRNIYNIQNFTIGNSEKVYKHLVSYNITVHKTVKGPNKIGTFKFKLYSDPEAKVEIPNSAFSITTDAKGEGSYTFDFAKIQTNRVYSKFYVFELDEYGRPVKNGEKNGKYTVQYGQAELKGYNDSISLFTDSYVENMGEYTGEFVLQKVNGATIYYLIDPNNHTGYESVTYDEAYNDTPGHNGPYHTERYDGEFPVNVTTLLDNARAASSTLVNANKDACSANGIKVINLVGGAPTYSGPPTLENDLTRRYFGFPQSVNDGYAVNTGIDIGDQFLLLNIDLTGVPEYKLGKIKINGEGTGDWNEIANRIIINPVQKDGNGGFVPYTGKINADIMSGTLVAPDAYVLTTGSYCGTVIGQTIEKDCEIHKIDVRRYLDESGSADVSNVDDTVVPFDLEFEKYVDQYYAGPTESGKFKFTLRMFDEKQGSWKVIDNNITNNEWQIKYSFNNPADYGMEYGGENTYYFMMTENDTTGDYLKDKSGLLAKVKYYPGKNGQAINEICYYRINEQEVQSILSSFSKGYYNDAHRIRELVGFYNKSRKPFDIEMFKYLNGSLLSDNTLKFNFWIRMVDENRNVIGTDRRIFGTGAGKVPNYITNVGSSIKYTVDTRANAWNMEVGKTYYFMFVEGNADNSNRVQTTIDNAIMAVKVDYYVDQTNVVRTYYRIADQDAIDTILANNASVVDYCTDANYIDPVNAGFYNKTPTKVSVIKNWNQNSTDDIWDITVVLKRRVSGGDFEEVERFVIPASDYYMSGGMATSKAYNFEDLEAFDENGNAYEYAADEYYDNGSELVQLNPLKYVVYDASGNVINESSASEDSVGIVNGYKNSENRTDIGADGSTTITLTNTPYIKLKKVWTLDGNPVPPAETTEFGTVFVNLYKSYDDGSLEFFKGPIALSPGNEWTAEVAVPDRVKYHIVECDSTGQNEYRNAPKITYYAFFKDQQTAMDTNWENVYAEGINTMLEVSNERSGNVLPKSGGIGELPYVVAGAGTAIMSLMGAGACLLGKRRKKEDEE